MRYIPAKFANSNGFVAGLTPAITISVWNELTETYSTVESGTMSDVGAGKYMYKFVNYDKTKLYDYSIDGGNNTLTSRYATGNNELDYYPNKDDWKSPGIYNAGNVSANEEKKKEKELIDRIANKVVEKIKELPQREEKELNISDIVVPIVTEIKNNAMKIDYGYIDTCILKSELKISNKIDKIKIPTYNEDKIIKSLPKIDLTNIISMLSEIDSYVKDKKGDKMIKELLKDKQEEIKLLKGLAEINNNFKLMEQECE